MARGAFWRRWACSGPEGQGGVCSVPLPGLRMALSPPFLQVVKVRLRGPRAPLPPAQPALLRLELKPCLRAALPSWPWAAGRPNLEGCPTAAKVHG